jgi:sensor domain CHASE-containing protein
MACISYLSLSILFSTHFVLIVDVIFSLQLPEEARELEKELRQNTKEKNEAVRSQDFEKVHIATTELRLISFWFLRFA